MSPGEELGHHVTFVKGRRYRATADTFSVPDFLLGDVVPEGDAVYGGEPVQRIPRGAVVLCLGIAPFDAKDLEANARIVDVSRFIGHAVVAFFEDVATGAVYRYQLSMRHPWPWAEEP